MTTIESRSSRLLIQLQRPPSFAEDPSILTLSSSTSLCLGNSFYQCPALHTRTVSSRAETYSFLHDL